MPPTRPWEMRKREQVGRGYVPRPTCSRFLISQGRVGGINVLEGG